MVLIIEKIFFQNKIILYILVKNIAIFQNSKNIIKIAY